MITGSVSRKLRQPLEIFDDENEIQTKTEQPPNRQKRRCFFFLFELMLFLCSNLNGSVSRKLRQPLHFLPSFDLLQTSECKCRDTGKHLKGFKCNTDILRQAQAAP
ncbi:hypothetical protein OUZ56_030571 [Daphnia magna]|uniref:Uncharacterized protein n=1 Tax=Daphnia magna TaxID=35525 RepID=A0ABQ9ZS91_9CRUS|nr:hypothetical protein OUZ56_030571 [Daphnia magna]